MVPIYATSTYAQESPGVHKGYEYSRSQNPTRFAFERCIADLESGTQGLRLRLRPGGHRHRAGAARRRRPRDRLATISTAARFRLFDKVRQPLGRAEVQLRRPVATWPRSRRRSRPKTRLIWVETPTNPHAAPGRPRGHRRAGQAPRHARPRPTTPSPARTCQRPLEHGFDIVMHSTTKYLNGHSDMVGGVRGGRRQRGRRRAADLPAERRRRHRRARSTASWRCAA